MEATTDELMPLVPAPPPPNPQWYRRRWFVALVILLLILFGLKIFSRSNRDASVSIDSSGFSASGAKHVGTPVDISRLIRDNEHSLGSPDAKVQIIEFGDFQCPYSAEAFSIIRRLTVDYGDRINFVYRHFPLDSIHDRARATAEASECAREQGKFWPYHDRLFQYQNAFSDSDLRAHADAIGLDAGKFDLCLKDGRYKSVVERDVADARALDVIGTPTWYVNGQRVEGVIAEDNFRKAIDAMLRNN